VSHLDSPNDTELLLLNQTMSYFANGILKVTRLDSGYTTGVDGQVVIQKGPRIQKHGKIIPGLLLYSLKDTGAIFFTKGTAV
jgi:hypothetical protein